MEHIFVAGAYFTTSKTDTDIFPFIVNIIKNNTKNIPVYQPTDIEEYRFKIERENPNILLQELNKKMVDYDLDLVAKSKYMIADVTNKSLGLGLELGVVRQFGIPLELIARSGSQISNMLFGAFPNCEVKFYKDKQELEKIILDIIKKYS